VRFLAHRGLAPGRKTAAAARMKARPANSLASNQSSAVWEPLGPTAVLTSSYGLVTGRISALALDSSDSTGNTLYLGATGGGVWMTHNAATSNPSNIVFTALTDRPQAVNTAEDASISIGAVTVQPGGTGVILAGTGDPNDALDSYYGAGILRSADGGNTWTILQGTSDVAQGLAGIEHGFLGEGFAGFAWSSVNTQLVVAAVSQSYESSLVDADLAGYSYSGLYYSSDAGITWHLARITDGNGQDVQGPQDAFAGVEGNAATAVVWNPLRAEYLAAVRFHGYYSSTDGITWTRLPSQPGAGLTSQLCPTNTGSTGSPGCPIFRGVLAVNPATGDTFAWTVDENNQDQGLWQDACDFNAGSCSSQLLTFSKEWNTSPLETSTLSGAGTILNGDYNFTLAAVPWSSVSAGQDTLLLAGANDLWRCSLAMGCQWRNATNSTSCMSAQVGEYQHALEWSVTNQLEIFIGNDSGLWRSEDEVAETGPACSASDASHFENLNGSLGSLAEVESLSGVFTSPYTLMAGLGANGAAGVKSTTGSTAQWPQILSGEGGPVAIDPTNPDNWYVNNGAGVSIHLCSTSGPCTPSAFGNAPVVGDSDVDNDGLTMTEPASFLVDPVDATQLVVATCRLWRGPANGSAWTQSNAITPMLGTGSSATMCWGNPLIRSVAAAPLPGGGEVVYTGTFGSIDGGANLPGHILSTTMSSSGTWSGWTDLTLNPIANDTVAFNFYNLDISSIVIDPHDTTGNTLYVTIAGIPDRFLDIRLVYSSTDGGAHWTNITSNLQYAPANALAIDPVDASTVYLASDAGVFSTRQISTCGNSDVSCWAAYGAGLPESPVTALTAAPTTVTPNVLVAGTYGRGIWQIPLITAGQQNTTAVVNPISLTFASEPVGSTTAAQPITLTNTSSIALAPTTITPTADFGETDNCVHQVINTGKSCTIQVTFTPSALGTRTGQLQIQGNLAGGNLTVGLSGIGATPGQVTLLPSSINFGNLEVGLTSPANQVTASNSGGSAVSITSVSVTGPFVLATNACGTQSLAPNTDCQLTVEFQPTSPGPATGSLTMVAGAGTLTVQLTGAGTAPPTDTLSPTSLTFPGTIIGSSSAALTVSISNSGGNPLTSISISTSAQFQQNNNCTTQLAQSSSCTINVTFLAAAAGTQTGALTVSDILRTQTVALSGIGLLPPVISVNPTSLSFGGQPVGIAGTPLQLTITNSGQAAMANIGFQVSGPSANDFATGSTTCQATLAGGANCTVQATFTPSATGLEQATLTVTSSTSSVKAVTVPLSGNGQSGAGLGASPPQLTFNATAIGQTSPAQTVTVSNNGGTAAAGLAIAATGPFSLTQNTCGATLAGGAQCTSGVVFAPTQQGPQSGKLTISSTSLPTPATVALSGIGGLDGALQILPASVSFPITGVGQTSSAATLTITNLDTSVALANFALTVSPGFQMVSTTCGTTLGGNGMCTVGVAFAPTSAGAMSGVLTIASSALSTSAMVPLSGMGFDFKPSPAGSSSQTVASGQTANFALSIAPMAGASGTFAFQCSGLPQYASCSFNPTSLQVGANATGTEDIAVSTSQSSAALVLPVQPGAALPAILACGLLFLPLARRGRRIGLVLLLVLAVTLGGVLGCSGSGGGGGGNPPPQTYTTPTGTYSIAVVVSSYGVQHTVSLTLVVD
jgi:hypothetical protein